MTFIALSSCVSTSQYPVRLGDTLVVVSKEQRGIGKSFIHLHQNETTALEAARSVVREQGGSLITLIHPGRRNIVFQLHHKRFEFDPNRIYTDRGIRLTLMEFGAYSPEAHLAVKHLADKIKRLLPKGKVIAVHNNETYSMKDYLPGHSLAHDARLLNKNGQHSYRNFYLVTQAADHRRLAELNFNTVWQALHATDDGSLSIFLANRHYVNVEAGYDQLDAQIIMLKHA